MTDQDSETDTKPENRMAQEMRKHLDSMARFTHRFVTTKAVADFHSFIQHTKNVFLYGSTWSKKLCFNGRSLVPVL